MGERRVQPEAGANGPRLCRCVVLVAPHGQLPRPLLRGLEQRGAVAIVATDAPAALVDLAYSRAGALIVQDPAEHVMVGELVEAVHRYFPRTTCWRYDTTAKGEAALSRLNGHAPTAAPKPTAAEALAAHDDAARRLNSLLVRVPHSIDPAHEPLISEEELAMLLGPTPQAEIDEDHQANGGRKS